MGKEDTDYFRELGPSGRTLTPTSTVGISSMPDQYVNLQLNKGFTFNLMCVGASGLGKTSLFRTLFRQPLIDDPHPNRSEEVSLVARQFDMKEANVNLKVTFIESRGFADQIDQTSSVKNIIEYLDKQFDAYLGEETKINRSLHSFPDSRVHACVYMISPTGHALYPIDILSMKALQSKVNLIPIIGKADILTPSELKEFKTRINKELAENNINVYRFPTDDRITAAKNSEMNDRIPFAVVSSAEEEVINKQLCRVRKYPWGTVVVDDDLHCEFMQFREMLLRSNLYDLILSTHHKFYEQYRISRFKMSGFPVDSEAENTRKKCLEIVSFADKQIRELSLKYDRDVKALDENFNASNLEISNKYELNLRELEHKRQELMAAKIAHSSSKKVDKKTKKKN